MEGKTNFRSIIIVLATLLLLTSCIGTNKPKQEKYNIILISIDTLRADHLHCYKYKYMTSPNIDTFAKKSLFFEYAYCPIPKTSASFASMMTGLHPFIHKTKPNRGYLKKKYKTLAEILKSNGYYNYAIVDNANLSKKFFFNQGFHKYIGVWDKIEEKTQSTPFITQKILSFLKNRPKRPFFIWANYIEPHTPYMPPKPFIEERPKGRNILKVRKKIIGAMRKIIKEKSIYDEGYYISLYDGAVKYVDSEIGKIINLYFKMKYNKNTIFIITSDHGEDLGEKNFYFNHGPLTFNAASRVPLILHIPKKNHRMIKTPVSIIDIYPTILKLLNIKIPYPIQGKDLLHAHMNRSLFIYGQTGTYSVVMNSNHYIRVFPKLSKQLNLKKHHVYNIYIDPYETRNIYINNQDIANELSKKYSFYFKTHGYLKKNNNKKEKKERKPLSKRELKSLKTLGYL